MTSAQSLIAAIEAELADPSSEFSEPPYARELLSVAVRLVRQWSQSGDPRVLRELAHLVVDQWPLPHPLSSAVTTFCREHDAARPIRWSQVATAHELVTSLRAEAADPESTFVNSPFSPQLLLSAADLIETWERTGDPALLASLESAVMRSWPDVREGATRAVLRLCEQHGDHAS